MVANRLGEAYAHGEANRAKINCRDWHLRIARAVFSDFPLWSSRRKTAFNLRSLDRRDLFFAPLAKLILRGYAMCKSILVRAIAVWMVALIATQVSAQNKAPNAGPQPKAAPG